MAEFAIASISSMDAQNKGLLIPGEQPALGSRLVFSWAQALGLLLSIVAAHGLLLVLIVDAEMYRRRVARAGVGGLRVGSSVGERGKPEDEVRLLNPRGGGAEGWRSPSPGRSVDERERELVAAGVAGASSSAAVDPVTGGGVGAEGGDPVGAHRAGTRKRIEREDDWHPMAPHERFTF